MIYLGYAEAVTEHIALMRALGETRYGVFDRTLIESALARPRQAAAYDNADLPAQAATLCYGLIKNHPWVGGNKRTATHLTDHFLKLNGWEIVTAGLRWWKWCWPWKQTFGMFRASPNGCGRV